MKSSDRMILIGLAVVAAAAAAWFVLISPKRDEVSKLDEEIAAVETSLAQQEQLIATADAARASYDRDYGDLVVLGKAVPGEAETSSLFVQLEALAEQSGTTFTAINQGGESGAAAPPPPPPTAQTSADPATSGEESELPADLPTAGAPAAAPAVATEASAALLPLGATVGPAGLPVMPYSIEIGGDFFQIADFLEGVDDLVGLAKAGPVADGRLITIDGFELAPNDTDGLNATLTVTTYVSPADQGLTGGATPQAPAPVPAAVPTSNAAPTP